MTLTDLRQQGERSTACVTNDYLCYCCIMHVSLFFLCVYLFVQTQYMCCVLSDRHGYNSVGIISSGV